MLVLTRRLKESIMIGDDIEVKIISIEGEQVKLGIIAPRHVEVHRREIYLDIQQANQEAAQHTESNLFSIQDLVKQWKGNKSNESDK